MSAISTVLLEFLRPGGTLLYSMPTYGGTDHFINHYLREIGVNCVGFKPNDSKEEILEKLNKSGKADKLALVFIETPANPTNTLIDISMCKEIADQFSTEEKPVFTAVDNTYMGPIWCSPLDHGADLVLYSATKYIGGHSDLIAGAVLGNTEVMLRVKTLRTFLGNMASPHTGWLLLRSLETLKIRMDQQAKNASYVANFLNRHLKIEKVYYLGLIEPNSPSFETYKKQYSSSGAMIAFDIKGSEKEAFTFLNNLKLIKLAVSLGSTESLAQHPATMTHIGLDPELKEEIGITESLVRISIGIENEEDIVSDISNALDCI
jgi:methionine-gamma-lyase